MNYLLLILCVGGAAFAQKLQLAVMPLEPKGIPAHEAELLSESLLGHLQAQHTYQLIERTLPTSGSVAPGLQAEHRF